MRTTTIASGVLYGNLLEWRYLEVECEEGEHYRKASEFPLIETHEETIWDPVEEEWRTVTVEEEIYHYFVLEIWGSGTMVFIDPTTFRTTEPPWKPYMGDGTTQYQGAAYTYIEGATNVAPDAFKDMTAGEVFIGASVTAIGQRGFQNVVGRIHFAEAAFLTTIGTQAFGFPISTGSLGYNTRFYDDLPDSVTTIGANAFCKCRNFTQETLPRDLTTIGDWAFGLTNIESVTFNENLLHVGASAYRECQNLAYVDTSQSAVVDIGEYCFYMSPLEAYEWASATTTVGQYAFSQTALVSVAIPNTVTSMGTHCYESCMSLMFMDFGTGMSTVPNYVCNGCNSLMSVGLPAAVTGIGGYAFNDCIWLTNVDVENVETIGTHAFAGCGSITEADFSSLRSIGSNAYQGAGLVDIEFPSTVVSLPSNCFANCDSLVSAYVPYEMRNMVADTLGAGSFHECGSLTVTVDNYPDGIPGAKWGAWKVIWLRSRKAVFYEKREDGVYRMDFYRKGSNGVERMDFYFKK